MSFPRPPGPPGNFFFGHLAQLRRDPLAFLSSVVEEHGDVAQFRLGPRQACLIRHPDAVRHVLHDNHRNYGKGSRSYQKLRFLLGNGLFTSEGEHWLRQRRIAQPAFHRERIALLAERMTGAAKSLGDAWEKLAKHEAPVDVAAQMRKLTLRILSQTLLGHDLGGSGGDVATALEEVLDLAGERLTRSLSLPIEVPTLGNLRFRRAVSVVESLVMRIIRDRRAGSSDEVDLISMLLLARDEETGAAMTDTQLRDEILTFLLAGHETTATALTWTWYLLDQNPQKAEALLSELSRVLQGRPPTLADIPQLRYTSAVLKESMRLFPPAWAISRRALADDAVGGYAIPSGFLVLMSPYLTHRHPDFWSRPEQFEPERFLPGNEAERVPRGAYLPFGSGPRQCIGNNFAQLEAELVLATLAPRFRLSLPADHRVVPQALIALKPAGGLPMRLQRR
jgi:cytochrome P450